MRSFLVILIICIAAAGIGGGLYLYGPASFHVSLLSNSPYVKFTPIVAGDRAAQVNERTNYRVQNADQLAALWELVYGVEAPTPPKVNFEKSEVLAVFDGSHSTSGYKVQVQNITDTGGKRMVTILRTVPGDSCKPSQDSSSPFIIVQVPKTPLALGHTEQSATTTCI